MEQYLCIESATVSAQLKLLQSIYSASSAEGSHLLYTKLCQSVCKSADKNALRIDSLWKVL